MVFLRIPSDYDELLWRYQKLIKKQKNRKAWELCIAFCKKQVLSKPTWFNSEEHARIGLLMAKAAFKAGAFERSFFNAKHALLVLRQSKDPSSHKLDDEHSADSFTEEIYDAEKIASDALHHLPEAEIQDVQNEWEKTERAYERAGGRKYFRAVLAVNWHLDGPFQKWRMRRTLKAAFKDPHLFGKWRTPD